MSTLRETRHRLEMELLFDVNLIWNCVFHDEIKNIECKIMATLGFGLEMMVLFDSLVINLNVISYGICPNSFGVCYKGGKPSVNLMLSWGKQ